MQTLLRCIAFPAVLSLVFVSLSEGDYTPKGYYSADGKELGGIPCPEQTYQPFHGKTFCYPCARRRYAYKEGSTKCSQRRFGGFQGQGSSPAMTETAGNESSSSSNSNGNRTDNTNIAGRNRRPRVVRLGFDYGHFKTPKFPQPYSTTQPTKWRIQCKPSSYSYIVLFTVDLRIGDRLAVGNKIIAGKYPFFYSSKLGAGKVTMELFLNSTDRQSYRGVQGVYVCIDKRWYDHWSSLPVMVLETQYSLRILQGNEQLLMKFLELFKNHDRWLFALSEFEISTHIFNIVQNVYGGADIPFLIPTQF